MPTSFTYRLAIAGGSGTGKTCLLSKLLNPRSPHNNLHTTTIGASLGRLVHPGNRDIEILIWDTAGDQSYISLQNFYLKNMDLVILTLDSQGNNEKFATDLKYLTDISRYINNDESERLLVFTKNDDPNIKISNDRINLAKNTLGIANHIICSAKENLHIDDIQLEINKKAITKFNNEHEGNTKKLDQPSVVKKIGFWDSQISAFGFWSRHKTTFKIMSIGTLGIFFALYKASQCVARGSSSQALTSESNSSTRNLPFPVHPLMYSDIDDELEGVIGVLDQFDQRNSLNEPLMLSLNQPHKTHTNRQSIQQKR